MTAVDLRRWRQGLNLTRKEAAALLGCSWRSLEAWEQGRKIPAHRAMMVDLLSNGKEAEDNVRN